MKFSNTIMWLMFIFLALSVCFWIVDETQQSSADDVKKVIEQAASSQEATQIINDELRKAPVPTWSQLRSLNQRVNEQLALELARKVTGDNSLQSKTTLDEVQRAKSQAANEVFFADPLIVWLMRIVPILIVLGLFVRLSWEIGHRK